MAANGDSRGFREIYLRCTMSRCQEDERLALVAECSILRISDPERAPGSKRAKLTLKPAGLRRPSTSTRDGREVRLAPGAFGLQGIEILRYEGLRAVDLGGRFDSSSRDSGKRTVGSF
jgi:hypothetical protein